MGGWLPVDAVKGVSGEQCISFLSFSSEGSYVNVREGMSDLSWKRCLSETQILLLLQTWLFSLVNSLRDFEIIVTLPTQSVLQFQTWEVYGCTYILETVQALFGNPWHHTNGETAI